MIPDWLKLDLPETGWEHPPAPPATWAEHLAFVDEVVETARAAGKFANLLPDFEETHRGEPFVMHD